MLENLATIRMLADDFVQTMHEPDADPARARQITARVRRAEDAWAMHANAANGFGAGEAANTP